MNNLEPFESARLLISSGKERIVDFEAACRSFVQSCRYLIVKHKDPQTGDQIFKFRFVDRIPPTLRKMAGDIIADLRHSLDHAFADGAILLGRPDARNIHFPFSKSASEIDKQIKNACRNVEPALCDFVKAYQPYLGGDNLLYVVADMSNMHKHRHLIRITLENSSMMLLAASTARIEGGLAIGDFGWNATRNELTFARIAAKATVTGNLEDNVTPAFHIIFSEGEPHLSGQVSSVLSTFASKVESIVLGIETETARILASRSV